LKAVDAKERLEALESAFSALAHAARRQILLTIHFRGGEMTAGDIARRFHYAWPTVTRHLHVLEEAGLVSSETHGRTRIYKINRERLELVTDWLRWFDTAKDNIDNGKDAAGS
jgi:DNA-binding transcriptional ArsR family regulator